MAISVIPGALPSQGGFDTDNNGTVDVTFEQYAAIRKAATMKKEVQHLNEYVAYYSTNEGDVAVSCAAPNLVEAAKIFRKSGAAPIGVLGAERGDPVEPVSIKKTKQCIAVAVPVHNIGIKTNVYPECAIDSGALATPKMATVENGTQIIFEANTPFGWSFVGWSVNAPIEKGGTVLSKNERETIEVWDQTATIMEYYANFEFNPELRSGRYMDINSGKVYVISFSPYSNYQGYININQSELNPHYFVIESLKDNKDNSYEVVITNNPNVQQTEQIGAKIVFTPTAIGLTGTIMQTTQNTSLGWIDDGTLTLKYVSPAT